MAQLGQVGVEALADGVVVQVEGGELLGVHAGVLPGGRVTAGLPSRHV